ncbi:MAG: threonine synthase [Rhodobacterales bacterium]|nr:MAG: threonine synthase [Rhodobacterales bacterium]
MLRNLLLLIFSALVLAILISLGNWQMRRLTWKTDILADIDARIAAPPVALPDTPDPVADRFLPVTVTGQLTGPEVHVLVSTRSHGARYRIVQAFDTGTRRLLVDRGIIPITAKDTPRPTPRMTLTGNLHWPDEIDSYTPQNDLAANIWFSRDVPTLADHLGTEPILLIVRQSDETDPTVTPLPIDSSGIPNDHLEYVVTWYGLALTWVVMTFYFLRRKRAPRQRIHAMKYISTRGTAPVLNFEEAMLTGLARDGGLYLPETIPTLSKDEIAALSGLSYEETAFRIMRPFIGDTFTDAEFKDIITRAYANFGHAARAPLVQLAPNHFLLELFHGPTLAFKDFAMQLIGQLFQAALSRNGKRVTIVGATSGDTGSAAIEAFRGLDNVDVFILFPHGRVSDVQRRQMTTPSESNVHALAIDGDFDDCQARVKDMFNHFEFRDSVGLAGVNSINWARVLAQVVYYFSSAVSLGAPDRKVSFTVPTGNFGDIFAGYIAKRMGLPIDRLVVATNQNDILHRCLSTSDYTPDGVIPSISPSMDIQVSSNFERALFMAYDHDGAAVAQLMDELKQGGFSVSQGALQALRETYDSGRCSEEETSATIARLSETTGEQLCPHTAVGVKVAEEQRVATTPMITLATAHPAKFPDAVQSATGLHPDLPPRMADLFDRGERVTRLPNDLAAIEALIQERRAR